MREGLEKLATTPHFKRILKIGGVDVTEYEIQQYDLNTKQGKLIWVRGDIETMSINGKDNMLFHAEYSTQSNAFDVEAIRREIRKKFMAYWGLQELAIGNISG